MTPFLRGPVGREMMTKPTTVRLPEELLEQLDRRARSHGKDRATLIRELLRAGLASALEDWMDSRASL